MKKEITLGQLIATAVSLLVVLITGWITITNKVTANEQKIVAQEKRIDAFEVRYDRDNLEMKTKQDKILETLNDIRVILENKQDRRK